MKNTKLYILTTILMSTLLISACNSSTNTSHKTKEASNATSQTGEQVNSTSNSNNKIMKIGEDSYSISLNDMKTEKFNFAVKTSAGIVWSPAPKMKIAPGTEANPVYYPTEPFTFYLSPANEKNLVVEKSKKLTTLQLKDGEAILTVDEVFGFGSHILYHTSSIFTDGAQPLRQQVWVMDVQDPTFNKAINEFHSTGGDSYAYAIDEKENLYVGVSVVSGNADGSSSSEAFVYNVSTGKKEKLDDYALATNTLDSIKFKYNNKDYSFKLQAK
ncbi:hypothetical protein [Paenibacillus piscarius]|uniref:hypothetical protein n=1 Tax=Paenibacillus piscarius TaxID=1089681 RepID=UPI001EE8D252|nr:hypothetical protein [Paenibacillus piscarius]